MPKPENVESVDETSEPLKLIHSGDTFLYFDSGKSDSRFLVFAILPALDLLFQSEICHCDGTFSVVPDVFYQVYNIHGVIENAVKHLVYALLPNKTPEKLFGCLEQFGKKVVVDFEAAVRNAIRKMQHDTEIQFCFFHLGQAVWRNVQKLGFTRKHMEDDDFWLNVKKMICMAFVPVDDVNFDFEALQKLDPSEEFQSLSDYFEDTYIGACRGNRRVKPKFDIADWNVFNRVLSGENRTNNALEAWNASFNKFVSTKHPALPKLIARFKDEQKMPK